MTFVVLLAGGWGERFWPRSRMNYPKQFLSLDGKESLIARSVRRFVPLVPQKSIRIVALEEQKRVFKREYPSWMTRLLWEPFGRNTAAAIALAVFRLAEKDPGATVIVSPCDAWIGDEKRFLKCLREGVSVAKAFDGVVTIGIPPTFPATGYGYIRRKRRREHFGKGKAYRVECFVEKPTLKKAKRLLRQGSLWNAGIFIFRIPVFLKLLKERLPVLYRGFSRVASRKGSLEREKALLRFYRHLLSKSFDLSFDRGILERTERVAVLPGDFGWRDLGSWRSLEAAFPLSRHQNVLVGDAYIGEGRENIFISKRGHLLTALGVSGLVAVHTEDVTLICPKERAEEVKGLVNALRREKKFSRYV